MYVTVDFTSTSSLLVELLGIDFGDVMAKLRQYHGAHVQMSWLCEMYKESIVHQQMGVTT